jgi:hypothetical protein
LIINRKRIATFGSQGLVRGFSLKLRKMLIALLKVSSPRGRFSKRWVAICVEKWCQLNARGWPLLSGGGPFA